MLHLRTPSRLHFGLLSSGSPGPTAGGDDPRVGSPADLRTANPNWPAAGWQRRRFGGVGLMVDQPGFELAASPARELAVSGLPASLQERALKMLHRLAERLHEQRAGRGVRVDFKSIIPEHVGLGSGTQLAMALTTAACKIWGCSAGAEDLPELAGRGKRSGIGVHGFGQGGFLVDGGKASQTDDEVQAPGVAPLVARVEFPTAWPIVVIIPPLPQGLSGDREQLAFDQGVRIPSAVTDRLSSLVLLGMLPALLERRHSEFSATLYEYNRLVGECFASVQGGPYAHPQLLEMIEELRRWGAHGVGQSSWGPTLFAVLPDVDQGQALRQRCCERWPLDPSSVWLTTANNRGATVHADES